MNRHIGTVGAIVILAAMTGCLNGPGFFSSDGAAKQSDRRKTDAEEVTVPTTSSDGAESASLSASADVTQTILVSEQSAVAGTVVSFPPGSLAVDTAVTIEAAADLSTPAAAVQLDLGDSVSSSGQAVSVQSSVAADPAQPFTVAIALPQEAALTAVQDPQFLVVFYKVKIVSTGKTVMGVIPVSELTVTGNQVRFFASNFGSFQAAYLKTEVKIAKQVDVDTPVLTKREAEALPAVNITSRTPFIVGAGEKVVISGTNFRPTMTLAFGGRRVADLKVVSDVSASFTAPASGGFGLVNLAVDQDGVSQTVSIFYRGEKNDLPLISLPESEVCSGVKYYDAAGTLRAGSKACAGPASCTSNGQVGCITTASLKAGDFTNLTAANIKAGVNIAGVTGTLGGSPANCTADGQQGCVTTAAFPAAKIDPANLSPGNVRNGSTIGGVAGGFPSATYPLQGASATPDLTNFISQLTNNGSFEFWDSEGVRRTGSGDADITAGNIASGVVLENFSVTGILPVYPPCSDAGQTNCVTSGSFRSTKNFRNTARSVTAAVVFDNTTTPGGAGLDIYDVIDDYQAGQMGLPPDLPWGSAYAASVNYWQDVTADGTCDSMGDDCVYRDEITGLMWSEQSQNLDFSGVPGASWPCGGSGCTATSGNVTGGGGSAAYSVGAPMRWWDAIYACDVLTFAGYSDWRLPTQKELMQAYVHGIRARSSSLWMDAGAVRWSSATYSGLVSNGITFKLADGSSASVAKTMLQAFVCVR